VKQGVCHEGEVETESSLRAMFRRKKSDRSRAPTVPDHKERWSPEFGQFDKLGSA
jgi:hypothetical protein